jgi:hypothetical protein
VGILAALIAPAPSPSASASIDPFNLDPAKFPPPPAWLLPAVIVITALAAAALAVMLVMWAMAKRKAAALGPERRSDWIDLKEVDAEARRHPRRAKPSD